MHKSVCRKHRTGQPFSDHNTQVDINQENSLEGAATSNQRCQDCDNWLLTLRFAQWDQSLRGDEEISGHGAEARSRKQINIGVFRGQGAV